MSDEKLNKLVIYGVKYFPSRGGTSRVAESIMRNLADSYDITIYCYKSPLAENNIPRVKTVQFRELPIGSLGVFIYYLITSLHLMLFVNRLSTIHAHKTDCAFFLPLLRLKFSRIVATSHEAPYHRDKWSKIGKMYFHLMEWFFMHSGVILTSISKPLAEYYIQRYKKEVQFIPNGIDVKQQIDTKGAKQLLGKLKIDQPFFMYSARRIMSTKGLHTMLEAIHILKSNLPVVIAGDDGHAKHYVTNLREKYSHLNLHFVGYIELPLLLGMIQKSNLFIFPSEIEGMSIMLLEVVAVGTPVICSDIPENTQVFTDSEVLYFKTKDALELSEKIKFAQSNPQKMKAFTSNAQNKIKISFDWKQISLVYQHIYESSTTAYD